MSEPSIFSRIISGEIPATVVWQNERLIAFHDIAPRAALHLLIVPNGTTDFSKPDGTGAYTLVEWTPGVRILAKRKPGNYWKTGRGNFDNIELRYIGDSAIRTQALLTTLPASSPRATPRELA